MLSVENVSLRVGARVLFDRVSLRLHEGQCVALAGRNGQGKSTLMKIIAGEAQAESGTVSLPKGKTVGYLAQDVTPPDGERTVLEEALAGQAELCALEVDMRRLQAALEARPDDAQALEALGRAHARFEALDGWSVEARAKAVLGGLGLSPQRIAGPLAALSGGWLMRVALGKLLLQAPDVLLLDEPTNHLDLETREWLLDFLRAFPGAILLTSHDRWFLDQLVSKVLELESGRLEVYTGNYSKYEVERVERVERAKAAYAKQQVWLKQQQEFIDRNRANASTASNVQSRIKALDKVERLELPPEPPAIRLRFPDPPLSGQVALRLDGVGKAYGDLRVLGDVRLELHTGEKLAVVGRNGAGKTTLLKIITGREPPSEGTAALGHNVTLQQFSQYEDDLPDPSWTLLQALEAVAPKDVGQGRLRTILGCFLFSGDDVEKAVGVLSGGERARLKIARMLVRPSNLLVLDEPTNHLDLHSKDLLLHALAHFPGTVIFVSHDREFLSALATSVLAIGDGRAVLHEGGYDQYRWRLAQAERAQAAQAAGNGAGKAAAGKAPAGKAPASKGPGGGGDRARERALKNDLKRLEARAAALEAALERDEARKAALEASMSAPGFFDDPARSQPVVAEHRALEEGLAARWTELEEVELALDEARAAAG